VAFLLIFATLVIIMIIGFKIRLKRTEIEIMRLLGASPSFIRNPFIGLFAAKSAYIGAILIASSFLYFVLIFPKKDYRVSKKLKAFILLCTLIFILFAISNLLVKKVEIFSWGVNIVPGLFYPFFMVYFIGFMTTSLLILIKKLYFNL